MKKILVTGAGGSPATNFVRSLRDAPEPFHLIGIDCDKYYLQRAETDEKYLVPEADDPDYLNIVKSIITDSGAEMIYIQTDQEQERISPHRDELQVRTCMPSHLTIEICQDKFRSFQKWKEAGIKVPETMLINTVQDLEVAFERFGSPVWLRAIVSPGGGKGSFSAKNLSVARAWMDFCEGWGIFTAAECLRPDSITWMSIWNKGELVVAQSRKRLYWEFANRAPSGVTGITGTGVTVSDSDLDNLALDTIKAIDKQPHGIFSVDFTYDKEGVPNPTEINIGRFFTTHYYFTKAGLNMPYIYTKLAFDEELPKLSCKINSLPSGLVWIRGMDFLPILKNLDDIEMPVRELDERKKRIGS